MYYIIGFIGISKVHYLSVLHMLIFSKYKNSSALVKDENLSTPLAAYLSPIM